jgi:demethylmenaquinone methyltransferase/2-methoxy-6-polyprenyl-1,4-benzoquinol methylase
MKSQLYFYGKVLTHLLCGNIVAPEAIRRDYDRLSPTYDEHFSKYVGKHSRELVRRMHLHEGARAVDLACGTGTLTLAVAEAVAPTGDVVGIDSSPGMLVVAKNKARAANLNNTRFSVADIRDGIQVFEDNSIDAVTCGWAIGYVEPARLIQTISRKLKAGGKLGLIENARDTLAPIKQTAINVAQALPQYFNKLMDLHMRLPADVGHLRNLLSCAELNSIETWEGMEMFEFQGGADVLNWVLHTGASAGFDTVMDRSVKEECDELFIKFIERDFKRDGRITVAHHFVAGIAEKEK